MSLGVGVSTMMGKGGLSKAPYIVFLPEGAIKARSEWKGEKLLAREDATTKPEIGACCDVAYKSVLFKNILRSLTIL